MIDFLELDEDEDDLYCTRQRPRKRCCLVWHQVGTFTVIACTHCPRVKRSWISEPEDAERVRSSSANHDQRCARLWWTIPAQRDGSRRAVAPPAVAG